eukprot:gene9296-9106_t
MSLNRILLPGMAYFREQSPHAKPPSTTHLPTPHTVATASPAPGADTTAEPLHNAVRFDNVSKVYAASTGEVAALQGIDLSVPAGSIFGIIGRSGAGKSSLLRTINRLESPSTGHVYVAGQDIATLDEDGLRGRIAEQGPVWKVFGQPEHDATRALLRTVEQGLPHDLLQSIQPEPPATGEALRVLQLTFTGEGDIEPDLGRIADTLGHKAQLLHGGIDRIQGHAHGRLIIATRSNVPAQTLRLWLALLDTITMVGVSGGIALLAGTPLAVLLVLTTPGGIRPWPRFNRIAGAIINAFRATPFIVLLVALIPLTRLITGSTIGLWAAVVPLSISATPFFARIAEVSLREVDKGLIEAAQAMGCRRWHIVRHVLLPEALPGIIGGFTITL